MSDLPLHLTQHIRAYFGLSQAELASYLGLSRALLASAETGRRSLPTAALLRLGVLAQAVAAAEATPAAPVAPAVPAAAVPAHLPPELKPLLSRYATCRLEAERLACSLGPLLLRAEQARRLLAVLPAMTAALTPADERPQRWLARLQTERTRQLGPAATVPAVRLQARIASFQAEAEYLANYFANNFGQLLI